MAIEKPGRTTLPTIGPAKDQAFAAYDQFNILMEWCQRFIRAPINIASTNVTDVRTALGKEKNIASSDVTFLNYTIHMLLDLRRS